MELIKQSISDGVATILIDRPKVNAINDQLIGELFETFSSLKADDDIRAVVLTSTGSFFSFGLDVPGYFDYTREEFEKSFTRFTELYSLMFSFPKPVIAAVNGHAVGGGCILALGCDKRIMARGKAKIGLNEITFGATVPFGSVQMLRSATGNKNASRILYSGGLYGAEEAESLGLVDSAVSLDVLAETAQSEARALGGKDPLAFASIKNMLRKPFIESIARAEMESISKFLDIWFSEEVTELRSKIEIR